MPAEVLRGVIPDEYWADMELRNRQRAAELIRQMGERYCCHPKHSPKKTETQ
jgi:hypothetical protein